MVKHRYYTRSTARVHSLGRPKTRSIAGAHGRSRPSKRIIARAQHLVRPHTRSVARAQNFARPKMHTRAAIFRSTAPSTKGKKTRAPQHGSVAHSQAHSHGEAAWYLDKETAKWIMRITSAPIGEVSLYAESSLTSLDDDEEEAAQPAQNSGVAVQTAPEDVVMADIMEFSAEHAQPYGDVEMAEVQEDDAMSDTSTLTALSEDDDTLHSSTSSLTAVSSTGDLCMATENKMVLVKEEPEEVDIQPRHVGGSALRRRDTILFDHHSNFHGFYHSMERPETMTVNPGGPHRLQWPNRYPEPVKPPEFLRVFQATGQWVEEGMMPLFYGESFCGQSASTVETEVRDKSETPDVHWDVGGPILSTEDMAEPDPGPLPQDWEREDTEPI